MQALIRTNPDAGKPPSKRRKLQPLQHTPVVDTRARVLKRYPEEMRHTMAHLVHAYLRVGSQERAWADEGRAHLIDFAQYRRRNHQSPIAAADRAMCERHPESFAKRADSSRHEALRKWFVHIRSPVSNGGGAGSAQDLPRQVTPGKDMQAADWEYCRTALIDWHWQDEDKRERRYHGLQHAVDTLEDAADAQSVAKADELRRIRKLSKTRSFDNLTACVMAHCCLSWATEQFHEPRTAAPHYTHAKRYLSKAPVLEYYRSKKKDPQNPHPCKIVKVRKHNPAFEPPMSSQQRRKERTRAPPKAKQLRTRARQPELEQQRDKKGNAKFLDHEMLYDDSKEQITASVDGFSIWMHPEDAMIGYRVCVREGEQLSTLKKPKRPTRLNQDKNYYMCITLPGYGVLDTALMKSGSKERSGSERGGSKYWFERIVEQELGFGSGPQAERLRQRLQDDLIATNWTVRSQLVMCNTASRPECSFVQSKLATTFIKRNSCAQSLLPLMRMLAMRRRRSSASLHLSRSSWSSIASMRSLPYSKGL